MTGAAPAIQAEGGPSVTQRKERRARGRPTFFCPQCWTEIPESALECPHCGYDLSSYERLSYEEKLILSLRHPLRENRMMAIRLLGDLQSERAVAALESMLKSEEDFYVLRETIHALAGIGNAESMRIIRGLRKHPSRLVRTVAGRVAFPDGPRDR